MILGQNLFLVRESQTFCPIRNVLENHDLGKTSLPPQIFLAGTPMVQLKSGNKAQNFSCVVKEYEKLKYFYFLAWFTLKS